MELTQEHLQVAFGAWTAAQRGGGIVLDNPGLYVPAHELADQGWLARKFVTSDGAMSWWWTTAAETALDLSALTEMAGRQK